MNKRRTFHRPWRAIITDENYIHLRLVFFLSFSSFLFFRVINNGGRNNLVLLQMERHSGVIMGEHGFFFVGCGVDAEAEDEQGHKETREVSRIIYCVRLSSDPIINSHVNLE